jgi:hypothetical protein
VQHEHATSIAAVEREALSSLRDTLEIRPKARCVLALSLSRDPLTIAKRRSS